MTHIFAVNYVYADDAAALDTHRPAHRQFLAGLVADGELLLSGPLKASEPGALLILCGEHAEGVRARLNGDPFQREGLVTHVDVHPWTPVLGAWLPPESP
ncbi:YciI family protein [Ornithinimicrobium sp. Arc0846-15]|nr:YciI family protein [Ornithinimicrobium laminariae]